jgi:hypothetical protein
MITVSGKLRDSNNETEGNDAICRRYRELDHENLVAQLTKLRLMLPSAEDIEN